MCDFTFLTAISIRLNHNKMVFNHVYSFLKTIIAKICIFIMGEIMKRITGIISKRITTELLREQFIEKADVSAYQYCIEYAISNLIYVLSLLIIGALSKHLLFASVYVLIVNTFKYTAGGAHASTKTMCTIISYSIFIGCMILSDVLCHLYSSVFIFIFFTLIGVVVFLAPVECKNKKLNTALRAKMKTHTFFLVLAVCILFLVLNFMSKEYVCTIMTLCIIIVAVNLLIGRITHS